MRTFSGICRFCSGGCGALFTVNKNEIVAVQGDPAHPVSQGALCPKAGQGRRRGPAGRVTRPLWRPPGADEWREISWRQAIALLAARLKEARDAGWIPEDARTDGIAVFGSAAITNEESYLLAKFARLLGSTYIEHQSRV
jgi:anaerobic selenocysteine-containing dehydrogenase